MKSSQIHKPSNLSFLLLLLRLQWNSKLLGHFFFFTIFLPRISSRNRNSDKSLGFADGSALLKLNNVSNFELVIWVMSLVLLLLPNSSLVLGMRG